MLSTYEQTLAELSQVDELLGIEPKHPNILQAFYLNKAIDNQNRIIKTSSTEIQNRIIKSTSNICGTLENGFGLMIDTNTKGFQTVNNNLENINDTLYDGFNEVTNSLSKIDSTLNWGFSKIIELNRQSNIYLKDIIELLNIPDEENVRKRKIEKGLEFLKKSIIDISVIADSKKYFDEALELEENDYFVLYNLGLIHLFSKKYLNFEKAKKYFLKSAKYSSLDISFNPIKYSTNPSSFIHNINPKIIATYSYLYASRCFYKLDSHQDALNYVLKSYKINPKNKEVIFDSAKYYACNNKIEDSIKLLKNLINIDRFTTLKILKDKDLIKRKEISRLLEELKTSTLIDGVNKYNQCKQIIKNDSVHLPLLKKANTLLQKETYLDNMAALDILN
jgi:tetratricopeptide (TPR) repeat protein